MVTSVPVLQQRHLRSIIFTGAAGLCTCTVFVMPVTFPASHCCWVCRNAVCAQSGVAVCAAKTLCKIFVTQRHCFGTATITIIFVSEAHLLCIYGCYTMVAYGYFVGVPTQVFYHVVWSAKRPFGLCYFLFIASAKQYKFLVL